MEPIEHELKRVLEGKEGLPQGDLQTLTRRIGSDYRRRQRAAGRLLQGYLLALLACLTLLFWIFFQVQDLKLCLLIGIGILAVVQGTVLMKLWYWVLQGKIAIMREVKLLQLLTAERLPPPSGNCGVSEGTTSPPAGEPGKPPHLWPTALVAVAWLGAVSGLVYSAWRHQDRLPSGAVLYFHTELVPETPGEGAAATFLVERSQPRFHPVLLSGSGGAEAWIDVGPEQGPALYQGPISDSSRIWFGLNPAPGVYRVRWKPVRLDAPCQLRIYGTDAPSQSGPGLPPVAIMLCAALAIAIPLLRLQTGLLREIDPELTAETLASNLRAPGERVRNTVLP